MSELDIYAYFAVYAFLGWICECCYVRVRGGKWINRGFLYGPVIPIYAFGALILIYGIAPISQSLIPVFLLTALFTSILEYVTSWGMEKLFHTRWWDYSDHKFNLNGRVCLWNTSLFGILGVVVFFLIHPHVEGSVDQLTLVQLLIAMAIFTVLFMTDFTMTLVQMIRRKQLIEKLQEEVESLGMVFQADMNMRISELEEKIQQWKDLQQEGIDTRRTEMEKRLEALIEKRNNRAQALSEWVAQRMGTKEYEELASTYALWKEKMAQSHIAKAFPEQRLPKSLKEIQDMIDQPKETNVSPK